VSTDHRHHPLRLSLLEGVVVLNLFGNLLLTVSISCSLLVLILTHTSVTWRCVLLGLGVAALWWGVKVTARIPRKLRIAAVVLRQVARKGYRTQYFSALCAGPCMRLMTWYLHLRLGERDRYRLVVELYRNAGGMLIEHSNPEVEALINSGELSPAAIESAAKQYLTSINHGRARR